MNTTLLNKLKELQNKIQDYGKYLEDYTYHPYDKVQEFGVELNKIILEIEDN